MDTITTPVRHIEIILEESAAVSDIKRALKLIKGIASIKVTRPKSSVSSALASQIEQARKEYQNGETTSCSSPEEMQQFFDRL